MGLFIVFDFPSKIGCHGCYSARANVLIKGLPYSFSNGPSHLENFASMPILGLMLLVYSAQFVNRPQISGSKSSKIHPKTKVESFSCSFELELPASIII